MITTKTMSILPLTLYHQIASYGKCVAANADSIERGICEREFQALRTCMRKVLVFCVGE